METTVRTESLKAFVEVLKRRRHSQENSIDTLGRSPITKDEQANDLLKAIPQAHVNELDYVIEGLEQIIREG